ncbi:hypothetical protein [Parafrankia sp. EAN1pec]|uniref:hypothetical protein n=1 Tax=Parafrankia sp. (strain EAN1pec) TaxID=298653 RepID=UPI00321BFD01
MFVTCLRELLVEFTDPVPAGVAGHGAVFERELVLADLAAGGCDLGLKACEVVAAVLCGLQGAGVVGGDSCLEDLRVGVHLDERVDDGCFEIVGADAVVVASGRSVAQPVVAGVVAVVAGAAVRGGPDVGGVASLADDPAGEFVPGGVRGAQRTFFCPCGACGVRGLEGVVVDDGGVRGVVPDAVVVDLAGVDLVLEDVSDGPVGPWPACAGTQSLCVQGGSYDAGSVLVADIHLEDLLDYRSFFDDGDEIELLAVGGVAVRGPAGSPSALLRLGAQGATNAFDHRGSFELGEHAQHLHEHAADGAGGVEGLGGGTERHAGLVEFIDDLAEKP